MQRRAGRKGRGATCPVVISRESSGGGAPLLKFLSFCGDSARLKILALALLFKVYSKYY